MQHVLEGGGDDAHERWHRVAGAKLDINSFYNKVESEFMNYKTLQEAKDYAKRAGYAGFEIQNETGDVIFYRLDYRFVGNENNLEADFNEDCCRTFFWNEHVL